MGRDDDGGVRVEAREALRRPEAAGCVGPVTLDSIGWSEEGNEKRSAEQARTMTKLGSYGCNGSVVMGWSVCGLQKLVRQIIWTVDYGPLYNAHPRITVEP